MTLISSFLRAPHQPKHVGAEQRLSLYGCNHMFKHKVNNNKNKHFYTSGKLFSFFLKFQMDTGDAGITNTGRARCQKTKQKNNARAFAETRTRKATRTARRRPIHPPAHPPSPTHTRTHTHPRADTRGLINYFFFDICGLSAF